MTVESVCTLYQVALLVKSSPASAGDLRDVGLIPGLEDALEEGMATHSRILAWRTPWAHEPGGQMCTELCRLVLCMDVLCRNKKQRDDTKLVCKHRIFA